MTSLQTIGVIGAGTMGNGIAQACAVVGLSVIMIDVDDAAVARGRDAVSCEPRSAGEEGEAVRGRQGGRAEAHRRHDGLRRAPQVRLCHRSRDRERGAEGQDPQAGRRARAARSDRRDQHLIDLDHEARRGDAAPGALHRHALLQPGADDGAGRGDPRLADRRRDRRGAPARWRSDSARRRSS